jgi:hypothetical protein
MKTPKEIALKSGPADADASLAEFFGSDMLDEPEFAIFGTSPGYKVK